LWNSESPSSAHSPGQHDSMATASVDVATHSPGFSTDAASVVGVGMNARGVKLYVAAMEAGNLSVEPGVMVRNRKPRTSESALKCLMC
jgi:hypothetical protein